MANAIAERKPCPRCKSKSILTCDGCHKSFCRKHSDEHRHELSTHFDRLEQEHNALKEEIGHEKRPHPLSVRIDVWERESIQKIQQTAEQARKDLKIFIERGKNDLKIPMTQISRELQNSREAEDYTEMDLNRWDDQLTQCRQSLEKLMNTYLMDDDAKAIQLIKVPKTHKTRSSVGEDPNEMNGWEKFTTTDKHIELSDDELVARLIDLGLYRVGSIFGTFHYYTGTHQIRFQFEKLIENRHFLGIVTGSCSTLSTIFRSSTSFFGWYASVHPVQNKCSLQVWSCKRTRDVHEGILTLYCDERRITLQMDQSKILELPVDLELCPFPWKIAVALINKDDRIRICH